MQKKHQESEEEKLLFYKIMEYPIPQNKELFFCSEDKEKDILEREQINSWPDTPPLIKEYLKYIQKWSRVFKIIPFIKTIYLCNSISFNKINEDSDIDIFIISKKNTLRRSRFWSTMIFRVLWLKRSFYNKKKKFCLSFYVTENHQNLYNISLANTDIYLAYRIAHLIPIYEEEEGNSNIYEQNTRISAILPNFKGKQQIFINLECIYGKSKIKNVLEYIQWGIVWKIIETSIKTIWLPIIIYKTKKLGEQWKDIIVNNFMLKFHADKRKKIALLYKLAKYKLRSQETRDTI